MKIDIQKQFLKAFSFGGVVHDSIDVIRQRYDLGFLPSSNTLTDKWQKVYSEILPVRIKSDTEAFDEFVLLEPTSLLIEELRSNLYEFNTIEEKERYVHSLITPFRELSELLYPEKSPKKRLEKELRDLQINKEYWESLLSKEGLNDFKIDGKKLELNDAKNYVKRQMLAIEDIAEARKSQYDRLEMISERFKQILNDPSDDVEKSLAKFCSIKSIYANRLDALLLQNNIDLLKLQDECGVYLKRYRSIIDVDYYIGSIELAEKYIQELPRKVKPINLKEDLNLHPANPVRQQTTAVKSLEVTSSSINNSLDNTEQVNNNPHFTEQVKTELLPILKDYFSDPDFSIVRQLLDSEIGLTKKPAFLSNGNKLTHTFLELYTNNLITQCDKATLIRWIVDSFMYSTNNKATAFKQKTVELSISGGGYNCKNPIIKIFQEGDNKKIIKL